MPIESEAAIEITGFDWVPRFARGYVRDLRPRWACEEAGLAYRERLISATDRPEWYFAEQPWGQVPVVRDGDLQLFESGAILMHLGEKSEALLPRGGQARADALSWLFAGFSSIEPCLFELGNITVFAKDEEWARLRRPSLETAANARFDRLAAAMAAALAGREWLAGAFSIADILIATVLREADRHGLVEPRPVLESYLARALDRPAFQAALDAQLAGFDDARGPAAMTK